MMRESRDPGAGRALLHRAASSAGPRCPVRPTSGGSLPQEPLRDTQQHVVHGIHATGDGDRQAGTYPVLRRLFVPIQTRPPCAHISNGVWLLLVRPRTDCTRQLDNLMYRQCMVRRATARGSLGDKTSLGLEKFQNSSGASTSHSLIRQRRRSRTKPGPKKIAPNLHPFYWGTYERRGAKTLEICMLRRRSESSAPFHTFEQCRARDNAARKYLI